MNEDEHYWNLAKLEDRFNSSSAGIRTLASAWLLAYFGAIGWLLSQSDGLLLPVALLVAILSIMACTGMATLYVMDQLVFHRLLSAVFIIGIQFELENSNLPPIRSLMMKSQNNVGTNYWERLFYLAPMIAIFLLSLVSVLSPDSSSIWKSDLDVTAKVQILVYILILAEAILIVWVATKDANIINDETIEWFGNEDFKKLLRNKKYEDIVRGSNSIKVKNDRAKYG